MMIRATPTPAAKPCTHDGTLARMADLMREMAFAGQTVNAEALALRGDFTKAEIDRYGREAADKARADSIRRVERTAALSRQVRQNELTRFGRLVVGKDHRGKPLVRVLATHQVPA